MNSQLLSHPSGHESTAPYLPATEQALPLKEGHIALLSTKHLLQSVFLLYWIVNIGWKAAIASSLKQTVRRVQISSPASDLQMHSRFLLQWTAAGDRNWWWSSAWRWPAGAWHQQKCGHNGVRYPHVEIQKRRDDIEKTVERIREFILEIKPTSGI